MKKVLSVALASAMVLGMGANAFAIQYSTGSNDEASWPKDFKFAGSLFVTDKDGDIVKDTITDLNGKTRIDFETGDTIWMPLYADGQRVYEVEGYVPGTDDVDGRTEYLNVELDTNGNAPAVSTDGTVYVDVNGNIKPFTYEDSNSKIVYWYGASAKPSSVPAKWRAQEIKSVKLVQRDGNRYVTVTNPVGNTTVADENVIVESASVTIPALTVTKVDGTAFQSGDQGTGSQNWQIKVSNGTASVITTGTVTSTAPGNYNVDFDLKKDQMAALVSSIPTPDADEPYYEYVDSYHFQATSTTWGTPAGTGIPVTVNNFLVIYGSKTAPAAIENLKVKVDLPEIEGSDANLGTIVGDNNNTVDADAVYADDYHYTGNIDKNWSINLIEDSTGVAELIEKAELYKADEVDYLSYKDYTEEIVPNGVYLKVTLKDSWKTVDEETLKYHVYIADNDSGNETNKVWVSGTYANTNREYVNFEWTNDASKAKIWEVKKGENGTAVFDFADKAFFTVKMYSGESMYLDLSTAYDKAVAGEMDAEADSFYKFDNDNANFSRTGELIIVTDDSSLVPYEIDEDGNFVEVDAKYVENYAIAHTNKKVDGFVFTTKTLGNYVLSTEELGQEEQPVDETPVVEEPTTETPATDNTTSAKPNPDTGAEDFVGLAVSLAVVSVAAAGALALKK